MAEITICLFSKIYIKDMVASIKSILFACVFLLIFSCNNEVSNEDNSSLSNFHSQLEEFKMVYPILNDYKWNIYSWNESQDKKDLMIELDGVSGDTTVVLALMRSITINGNNINTTYSITRFIKSYEEDNATYNEHFVGSKLLYKYYYFGDIDDPRKRIFVKGKYRYLYELGILDSLQKRYYLLNKDSLDEVIGDSILELPSIGK